MILCTKTWFKYSNVCIRYININFKCFIVCFVVDLNVFSLSNHKTTLNGIEPGGLLITSKWLIKLKTETQTHRLPGANVTK